MPTLHRQIIMLTSYLSIYCRIVSTLCQKCRCHVDCCRCQVEFCGRYELTVQRHIPARPIRTSDQIEIFLSKSYVRHPPKIKATQTT